MTQPHNHPSLPEQFNCEECMRPVVEEAVKRSIVDQNEMTQNAEIQSYAIRSKDLQYCMKHNLYTKKENGKWRFGYDLTEVLHLIV